MKSLVRTLTTLQTIWLATLFVYWNIYVIQRGILIRPPYLSSSYCSYTINNLHIKKILYTEQCSGSIFTDSESRLSDESGSRSKFLMTKKFKNFSWKKIDFCMKKKTSFLRIYKGLSSYTAEASSPPKENIQLFKCEKIFTFFFFRGSPDPIRIRNTATNTVQYSYVSVEKGPSANV